MKSKKNMSLYNKTKIQNIDIYYITYHISYILSDYDIYQSKLNWILFIIHDYQSNKIINELNNYLFFLFDDDADVDDDEDEDDDVDDIDDDDGLINDGFLNVLIGGKLHGFGSLSDGK